MARTQIGPRILHSQSPKSPYTLIDEPHRSSIPRPLYSPALFRLWGGVMLGLSAEKPGRWRSALG